MQGRVVYHRGRSAAFLLDIFYVVYNMMYILDTG